MTPVKCFFLEPLPRVRRELRRFTYSDGPRCTAKPSWGHDSKLVTLDVHPFDADAGTLPLPETFGPKPDREDPRWPVVCESCGYVFQPSDEWQISVRRLYRDPRTGAEVTLTEMRHTPGAMWDAWWRPEKGPDGRSLVAVCPGGHEWHIDGHASNCTMPEDYAQREHHCWTRRGEPPAITVGKQFGPTCRAGAGSIQTPNWHGFLVNGEFRLSL